MGPTDHDAGAAPEEIVLGGWLVRPELNRMSRSGRTVQLEPRLMDLLVFLARHAGRVVTKDELIDGVWHAEVVSEWAITRAIAKLRRALGDSSGDPRFIETISKRGYRLIAAVQLAAPTGPGEPLAGAGGEPPGPEPGTGAGPFVVGQWVRGAQFYGRRAQIAEVLEGNRDCLWVLGTRVSGKTSLLRQLEHLACREPERRMVPVLWDLQGAEDPADLDAYFRELLLDNRERLEAAGVDPAGLAGADLFSALGTLRRALAERGRTLLLLCDEAEELLRLADRAPALLRRLRRALQAGRGLRTVLAASCRLWALAAQRDDTSPFLHGFTPPLYLGPLPPDDAEALLRQSQLDKASRPIFEDAAVARALELCGGHPCLIQLLGARYLQRGDLTAAVADVAADTTLHHLFGVDLALLAEDEAALLRSVAAQGGDGPSREPRLAGALLQLERLGLVRRDEAGCPVAGNHFLGEWLRLTSST